MVLGYVLALALGIVDFLTEEMFRIPDDKKMRFISFAAGVSVSYLFLILLPEIYIGASSINPLLFFPLLFGFAIYHLIEKFIRQKHGKRAFSELHAQVHLITSFFYSLVVGFVLVKLVSQDMLQGILLFVPLTFHIAIDSLPKKMTKHYFSKAFFSSAPFIGALLGTAFETSELLNISLLGIVGGALLYMVVRESFPKEREGHPMYFLIGMFLFIDLVLVLWNTIGF
ncbi:MAG: hypothetical protein O2779_05410 [Nanoarchaeota archaeon]|nr:hypothetical protein [Nanoarchaeota archaeon]